MRNGRGKWTWIAVTASVLLIALASAPTVGFGADHLDAPGLISPGGDGALDIGDIFVFQGSDDANTVIAMTTNPAAGALSSEDFSTVGLYRVNIDNDGDAIADAAAQFVFSGAGADQTVTMSWVTGADGAATTVAQGSTNEVLAIDGGGQLFAGLRSDPFFFDLGGFLGTVENMGDRRLNDGAQADPFADFNSNAIVIEVPDGHLGANIGVWGATWLDGTQIDRLGRAAINTVVNSSGPIVNAPSEAKNIYNASDPKDDVANFTAGVVSALQAFSSLDSEGAYADAQAAALAGVLLPDVVTYDTATDAAGPLNGRTLTDDVIDVELRIVTGGDPLGLFEDRDADGAINTDGIGPHSDLLSAFPYLGEPHVAEPPPPPEPALYNVTVKVENLAPMWGNFLTPVWAGFHDGSFDLYNLDEAAAPGLERIAEDGNTGPLSEWFLSSGAGSVDGVIPGPNGPIAPNDYNSLTFTMDANDPENRYFSYASMVIPSNDAFVANGDPAAYEIFDAAGAPVGRSFFVTGSHVRDAGTEVNDELPANTAFFGQAAPDTGVAEDGVVTVHAGFNPRGSGGILDDAMFAMADFTQDGYPVAKISFTIERAPVAPAGPSLQYGTNADRSDGSALDGATVGGDIYVWVAPLFPEGLEEIASVDFLVNGSVIHTECCAPYDMIGGGADAATRTWNTRAEPNGETTVTARANLRDGTSREISATFTIAN